MQSFVFRMYSRAGFAKKLPYAIATSNQKESNKWRIQCFPAAA